ncbi:hypothetical protein RIF29_39658 [Crotalaria pallida]|uniref:Late embryogenesis abundant protein LEA-2 subgroup domain-containing protein n=1 Tax=Crotalaria pallida TaxID=3830 RepID=A0AAN9HPZ4_CROPI
MQVVGFGNILDVWNWNFKADGEYSANNFFSHDSWQWVKTTLEGEFCNRFLVVLWWAWRWRNNSAMEQVVWSFDQVCHKINTMLQDMNSVFAFEPTPARTVRMHIYSMADNNKQPQLNGAFYGPAIPPAEQPRYHHNRRGRSCCCCLFGFVWKLLLALIVLVGLAILIFYLIVQPRPFKFYVNEAELTRFDYANNTLRYNMVLNFTARNPNKKLSIYYDKVEALAFYEDARFHSADVITHMNSFRQYKKSTDPMSGVFSGQQVLLLDIDQVSKFNEDKNDGAYDIYVKLYFRIRFRLGDVITRTYKPKVKCDLKVPLSSNKTMTFFKSTQCDVDF